MKKKAILLSLILIGSGVMTGALVLFTTHRIRQPFERALVDALRYGSEWRLTPGSNYIAGERSGKIYIGDFKNRNFVMVLNADGSISQSQLPPIQYKSHDVVQFMIDSADQAIAMLSTFDLFGIDRFTNAADLLTLHRRLFANVVLTGKGKFIARTLDADSKEYTLSKKTGRSEFISRPGILEKQIDGLFCTDGMLLYSGEKKRVVYIYNYRNQFTCMDTSLNILYRAHTIDTTAHANIRIAKIGSGGRILSSPARVVNHKSCTYGNLIFINSTVLGKNEILSEFQSNSMIDVYFLDTGIYKCSFYLPFSKGVRIRDFRIFNGVLYGLYEDRVIGYLLSRTLLE